MAKLVKILKNEPLVSVIKRIKTLKGEEAVFEIPKGAALFKDLHNLVLVKKSAAALGKTVIVRTDDQNGKAMVTRAGLLLDDGGSVPVSVKPKSKKVKFGDIGSSPAKPVPAARLIAPPDQIFGERKSALSRLRLPAVSSTFSKYFVLGITVLVLAVFGAAVLLPQANITVYARSEPIMRDMEIAVSKDAKTINSDTLTVPGEMVTREISHTMNFPATGVRLEGEKAVGTVQLYNFTLNTLTLRASTTTLVAEDGKRFQFARDVTGLRPTARIGQGSEQTLDETSLIAPVPIVAAEVGADYNIGSDVRLEIQNAALGQADVYAMTAAPLTGGSSREIKILSQEDIDKATAAIQNELPKLTQAEIAAATDKQSTRILDNAVNSEILAKTANKEPGAETENFDMTVIARVNALSFNQDHVRNLVVEKINAVLSEDKYLLEGDSEALQASFKAVDVEQGVGVLAVHFETVAAYKVENTNLSRILAGKNALEIKEILLTRPEIDRVDIEFSPFFVNKAPRFNGKIYIETVQSQI